MKTFVISYVISLTALIFYFLPSAYSAPIDIIPRMAFYLSFPIAICLSTSFIVVAHLVGQFSKSTYEKMKDFRNMGLAIENAK